MQSAAKAAVNERALSNMAQEKTGEKYGPDARAERTKAARVARANMASKDESKIESV